LKSEIRPVFYDDEINALKGSGEEDMSRQPKKSLDDYGVQYTKSNSEEDPTKKLGNEFDELHLILTESNEQVHYKKKY